MSFDTPGPGSDGSFGRIWDRARWTHGAKARTCTADGIVLPYIP